MTVTIDYFNLITMGLMTFVHCGYCLHLRRPVEAGGVGEGGGVVVLELIAMSSYEKVLGLDVTMNDAERVKVRQGRRQILRHPLGFRFAEFAGGGDGIKQVAALQSIRARNQNNPKKKKPKTNK